MLRRLTHSTHAGHLVDNVIESHQSATALVDNLLEFSRVDAGIMNVAISHFPVQRLLEQLRIAALQSTPRKAPSPQPAIASA